MKFRKIILTAALIPLLASCGPKELVIPTVDVEAMEITLPDRPVYNTTDVKSDETFDYLDFYEISDFHGAVNYDAGDGYPGLSRLATYFNLKREENVGGTILLSSGDMFQGSAESNLTRGYMVNYAMNYMGFEAMALGNHEFDWTDAWIRKNANLDYKGNKIQYLGANIFDLRTNNIPDFLSKSKVITRGNHKIGVIGTIGSSLTYSILHSCIENYEFRLEKGIVEAEAQRLRNEDGCDVVVWLTHNAVTDIPVVTGVDAIFGGHKHKNVDDKPVGSVPAVATKNYGRGIGHIGLKIEKAGNHEVSVTEAKVYTSEEINFANISENDDINTIMEQYNSKINDIKNIHLGSCNDVLTNDKNGTLKNLCLDAMHQSALKSVEGTDIPADKIIASYHNVQGGIRANIEKGKITYGDVYAPFPFDNEIVLMKVTGQEYYTNCADLGNYGCWHSFKDRQELDKSADYYIVLTDYIALGDGQDMQRKFAITEEKLIHTGKIVRDEVANLIFQKGGINVKDYSSDLPCYSPVTRY